jgi:myo-inositol-1(or 4)-monophosphatase
VREPLAIAVDAAATAGAMLLARWKQEATGVAAKSSSTDLVSDADRAAEEAIVATLVREFPDDTVVAEEGSLARGGSGRTWYVDPLDGTINYLYRLPHWSVVLALVDATGPLLGVVYDPVKREIFHGERGRGAFLDTRGNADAAVADEPRRVRPSACADLGSALVATGFSYVAEDRAVQGRIIGRVVGDVRDVRRFGSAALDLAYVAAGRVDAYFESVDKPWDWMAGALLVREAGGRVTELRPSNPALPRIVASAPAIHDDLVALLERATQSL